MQEIRLKLNFCVCLISQNYVVADESNFFTPPPPPDIKQVSPL
jgi:hypothetical protein